MVVLAWTCAIGGLVLGGIASLVPGFPGCAVALLGLVAFASLTGFEIVDPVALLVATGITVVGAVAQLTGPVSASRAFGGSAGAATGAALGAAFGALIPAPGASWIAAIASAVVVGGLASRGALGGWVRGVLGTSGGCLVSVAADGLAVLGIGAVLGFADFLHALPPGR
ncbi:MAG: hypothetical protein ABMB14_21350 [Myxococcota bacterium]